MDAPFNQVFSPTTLADLFAAWGRFPDAIPYAGGTELLRGQGQRLLHLPKNVLSLARIDELRKISRTERFLEVGSMVTLGGLLGLGKTVPPALAAIIPNIANPQIRNMATIGGNICCRERRMDCFAALTALDASVELRTAAAARWVTIGRFGPSFGPPLVQSQELMTRIRLPLETWNVSMQARLGPPRRVDDNSAAFSFLARCSKDILSDVRVVFAGKRLIRDREIENIIIGKTLPLGRKETVLFIDRWREKLKGSEYPSDRLKSGFFNLIEEALKAPID